MSDIASETITVDIGCKLEFRSICVSGAYVSDLELFELLLCAEFVGLGVVSSVCVCVDGYYHFRCVSDCAVEEDTIVGLVLICNGSWQWICRWKSEEEVPESFPDFDHFAASTQLSFPSGRKHPTHINE